MDKDNIVDFPEREHEEEVHKCDSCASAEIHELTHRFQDIDDEYIISDCLDSIFEAIDEDNEDAIVDAVCKMFWKAVDEGYKQHEKNMIHMLASDLHMRSVQVDSEDEQ